MSNIIWIALACCEKHTYDVRLNLHTFVHVVSEEPEVVFKKIENVFKGYQNSSKNRKSSKHMWYFNTPVNTMSTYTPQISPTDCNFACKILLQKFVTCDVLKQPSFTRFDWRVMKNFRLLLNLNVRSYDRQPSVPRL